MATMIATHGRNLKGSSNVVLYLEAVIFTAPYCTVVKSDCPASSLLLKQTFAHHIGMCFSLHYLKSIFGPCCSRQHSLKSQ